MSAEAARQLHGGSLEETEQAIKDITKNITESNFNVTCGQQRINLTYCEIQSIRHFSAGDYAICLPRKAASEMKVENIVNATDGLSPAKNITEEVKDEFIFDNLLNCTKGEHLTISFVFS